MDQAQIRKVRDTLIKARAIQAERGLAKHMLVNDTNGLGEPTSALYAPGSVCMRGALNIAITGKPYGPLDPQSRAPWIDLLVACEEATMGGSKENWTQIPDWNNADERTLEEVLDLFDRTIERLEELLDEEAEPVTDRELVLV